MVTMSEQNDVSETVIKRIKPVNLLLIGLFIGVLSILALRVALVQDHHVHHHANFALYINGQRDEFKNFTFYEEVAGCSADEDSNPKHRVHMHNNINDTVHVHAEGVTWGHFFANLGYGLANNLVKTDQGVYVDGQDGKALTFILNGKKVDSIANRLIESEDRLLIDYGGTRSEVQQRADAVAHTAHEANEHPDPASCSGTESLTFSDRLKRALDFTR